MKLMCLYQRDLSVFTDWVKNFFICVHLCYEGLKSVSIMHVLIYQHSFLKN